MNLQLLTEILQSLRAARDVYSLAMPVPEDSPGNATGDHCHGGGAGTPTNLETRE